MTGQTQRLKMPQTRFFTFLKAEAIRAYYTSRHGLRELNYKGNWYYAASPGCPGSGKP